MKNMSTEHGIQNMRFLSEGIIILKAALLLVKTIIKHGVYSLYLIMRKGSVYKVCTY